MVGRTVSQYRFLEKLGAGGMGEIYKAQDTRLNRIVAVKVLPSAKSGDPERRRRFLQEAQAASGLNHPSIITIHDVISEGDTEFMVMEYVAGKTLNDLIPKGGLRVPQALKYALQMSDALATAHNAGIVHRDLKPANVMVTDSGLVKVLDFGLAKLTDPNPVGQIGQDAETVSTSSPLTVEGSILGTVNYMSPEQAQGRKVDVRSDVFSFGVVLYEMLTGLRAFEGETSLSTLSAILRDEAKPMIEVAPDVPPQLESVIQRCLRKNPDDRWMSMKDVQLALSALKRESDSGSLYTSRIAAPRPPGESVSRGPAASKVSSAVPPVSSSSKVNPMIAVAVVAVVLVLGGGAWWMMKQQAARKLAAEQAAAALAQAPPPQPAPETAAPPAEPVPAAPAEVVLNNDMVLDMVKEKLPTSVILSQIRSSKTNFDFSTAEVIRLSKGGVSANIIETMRDPKKVPAQSSNTNQTNAKQTAPAPVAAPVTAAKPPVAAPVPAPAPVPIAVTPAQPLVATPAPAPTPQTVAVSVPDGLPFKLALAANVPADADMGRQLRFTAVEDFRVQGVVVIPKGASITGEISETPKKKLFGIGGGKLSFKLTKADAAGGQAVAVRAAAAKRSDGPTQRAVEAGTKPSSKDIAASQGTEYIGYVDGAQTINVQK